MQIFAKGSPLGMGGFRLRHMPDDGCRAHNAAGLVTVANRWRVVPSIER